VPGPEPLTKLQAWGDPQDRVTAPNSGNNLHLLGRVFVTVRKAPQLEHYFLNAWVQTARGDLQQLPLLENTKTDDTVAYAWSKLGEWFTDLKQRIANYQNDNTTGCDWAKYQIELFLPIDLLNQPIEQVTPEDEWGFPSPLGEEHRVVVRSADRLEATYKARKDWEEKWKRLRDVDVGQTCATQHLLLANCSSDELGRLVKQQLMRPDVIGIRRSQPPEVNWKGGFLGAILRAGLPVAAWVRCDVPDLDCAVELDRLITGKLTALPDRIFKARQESKPIAQHISLLWDDPTCLPTTVVNSPLIS